MAKGTGFPSFPNSWGLTKQDPYVFDPSKCQIIETSKDRCVFNYYLKDQIVALFGPKGNLRLSLSKVNGL